MGSSWPRDQTRVSYIGRRILYHWATREAPEQYIFKVTALSRCNSHTILFNYLKCTIQLFSISEEGKHHSNFRTFSSHQKTPSAPFLIVISNLSPCLHFPLGTRQPQSIKFCLCGFAYSGHFIKMESWYKNLSDPYCGVNQDFIPFYGWILFHCMDRPHFVYSFIHWWTFGFLPLCGAMGCWNPGYNIGLK